MTPPPRRLAAVLTAALALGATACGAGPATRLYTAPGNPLLSAAAQLRASGHPAEAAELRTVAETPAGVWAAGQPGDIPAVRQVTRAAAQAGAIPVIVAYNLPDRDACGHFSASGGPTAVGYQTWINQLATAIGNADVIVVVEPDALPDLLAGCLDPAQQAQRYQLLRYAMRRLGALPRAQVYLDAGNPAWPPASPPWSARWNRPGSATAAGSPPTCPTSSGRRTWCAGRSGWNMPSAAGSPR